MRRLLFLAAGLLGGLGLAGLLRAQDVPRPQEEVIVRWWIVPIYALNADGSPARDLKPEDLAIEVGGVRVPTFTLHRKAFRSENAAPAAAAVPAPVLPPPLQRKMVVLAFDASFTSYSLLARARTIAAEMLSRPEDDTDYLVFSIEPSSGLKYVFGPDRDRAAALARIEKLVQGKKTDYLQTGDLDATGIRNPYPYRDPRNPEYLSTLRTKRRILKEIDLKDNISKNANFLSSLMILNAALSGFREASRIVYLFSAGPPKTVMERETELRLDNAKPEEVTFRNIEAQNFNYRWLDTIGRRFNENGILLLTVNPAGTRVPLADRDSGEIVLRTLADRSGGRYFEGAKEDIAKEVVAMEGGYYEVSFPDSQSFAGDSLELTARANRHGLSVFSVRRLGRERKYPVLSRFEKEILVLNLLREGFATGTLKPMDIEADVTEEKGNLVFRLDLPMGLNRDLWDVYKVWRHSETGEIRMEEESFAAEKAGVRVEMTRREGFRHDLVLVHGRTAVALLCGGR